MMDRRGFLSLLLVSPVLAASYDEYQAEMLGGFTQYKGKLEEEFNEYVKILNEEYRQFKKSISHTWDTPIISSKHTWVQYSQDFSTRSILDFEKNTLKIESQASNSTATAGKIKQHWHHIIQQDTKSAVENDAMLSGIDRKLRGLAFTTNATIPAGDSILGLAFDENDSSRDTSYFIHENMRHVALRNNSSTFRAFPASLQHTSNNKNLNLPSATTGSEFQKNSGLTADHVLIKLPSRFLARRAKKQMPIVLDRANKYRVSFSTIMAVMHTESSFNPLALSEASYGLMMINPETSGQIAHKKVYGNEKIITPNFLYNNTNNVELGSAYFNVMYYDYLHGINDSQSRLYCTVAAYNAGLGSVARAFTGRPILKKSFDAINTIKPEAVLKTLQDQLAFEESKIYLSKVNERIQFYHNNNS